MSSEPAAAPGQLDELLEFIKTSRGFDFSGYKRSSLQRRIDKRMDEVGVTDYVAYQDRLEVEADEFVELFNTILINVTAFFRDPAAWAHLAEEIVPRLLESIEGEQPIRVWSAACASGEEAYTVAIVLAEAMGEEAFRRRVKIYATDVDDDALSTARQATYPSKAFEELPDEIVARYFEKVPAGLCFRSDLRRSIIFGRNDIVQDAPISRIDLLVCRNALMYFTPDTQLRILTRFNFALRESGYLFLGKSEMLIAHAELFTPESLKWRTFTKVPGAATRDRFSFTGEENSIPAPAADRYALLRDGALDVSPVAQVAIDRSGFVAGANQPARAMFEIGPADVGRPLQDLQLSYRPVELRSALEQAHAERSAVEVGRVGWRLADGDVRTLQVRVVPLYGPRGAELGTTVTFEDVTELARLDEEHQRSQRELETAYEELQSTVEELETTNEELQSTNEELETTNEELQSTNEELETMNEELQSTNDELEVVNDEQREQSRQLNQLTLFLEGILGSLDLAVVVLDQEQRVQLWNGMSQDMWGLRAAEVVDQSFFELDLGLPVDRLREAVAGALESPPRQGEATLEAINRRGRSIHCMVRTMPLGEAGGEILGAIILMREQDAESGTGP